MENPEDIDQENGMIKEPLLNHPSKQQGGLRTLPFILGNTFFHIKLCLSISNLCSYVIQFS